MAFAIKQGGTGATTLAGVKTALGIDKKADLGSDGKILSSQIPTIAIDLTSKADLGTDGKVLPAQLPASLGDYSKKADLGTDGKVLPAQLPASADISKKADLGTDGKVLPAQLPSAVDISKKADLDSGGKVPVAQLPSLGIQQVAGLSTPTITTEQLRSALSIPTQGITQLAGITGQTVTADQLKQALGYLTLNGGVLELAAPPRITTASIDRDGWVNPETAGADPTGVSDSSTAFQVSLDLLANRNRGGGFRIPVGTCVITQPLTYQSAYGIKMAGVGQSSRIRQSTADYVKMFDFRPPAGQQLRGLTLEDFYVECNATNARTFEVISSRGLYVKNVSGEVLNESKWWSDVYRFISVLESRMDGGVWKNALGSEGSNFGVVRGRLFNFFSTVLNFAIHKPLAVAFETAAFGDTTSSPGLEGLSFYDANFILCNRGVDIRNQGDQYGGVNSTYGAPASVRMHGGHIHSFSHCIRTRQGSCNIIDGMLLFRDLTHGQTGEHIFAGRQHNVQISNIQNRVVGNQTNTSQGAPPITVTGGDYAQLSHISSFVAGTTANSAISAGTVTITDMISNGPNLTGNGVDVFTSNSVLTAVRLV